MVPRRPGGRVHPEPDYQRPPRARVTFHPCGSTPLLPDRLAAPLPADPRRARFGSAACPRSSRLAQRPAATGTSGVPRTSPRAPAPPHAPGTHPAPASSARSPSRTRPAPAASSRAATACATPRDPTSRATCHAHPPSRFPGRLVVCPHHRVPPRAAQLHLHGRSFWGVWVHPLPRRRLRASVSRIGTGTPRPGASACLWSRARPRFRATPWTNPTAGASLARSSQPRPGATRWPWGSPSRGTARFTCHLFPLFRWLRPPPKPGEIAGGPGVAHRQRRSTRRVRGEFGGQVRQPLRAAPSIRIDRARFLPEQPIAMRRRRRLGSREIPGVLPNSVRGVPLGACHVPERPTDRNGRSFCCPHRR